MTADRFARLRDLATNQRTAQQHIWCKAGELVAVFTALDAAEALATAVPKLVAEIKKACPEDQIVSRWVLNAEDAARAVRAAMEGP